MNPIKYFLASSLLMISSLISLAVASNMAPIAACVSYLNNSDAQFDAMMATNNTVATTAADALSACQIANACNNMTSVDHCAVILANRVFESTYYAHFNPDSNINHVAALPSNSTVSFSAPPIIQPPPVTVAPTPSTPAPNTSSSQNNPPSNAPSSSIHWF